MKKKITSYCFGFRNKSSNRDQSLIQKQNAYKRIFLGWCHTKKRFFLQEHIKLSYLTNESGDFVYKSFNVGSNNRFHILYTVFIYEEFSWKVWEIS